MAGGDLRTTQAGTHLREEDVVFSFWMNNKNSAVEKRREDSTHLPRSSQVYVGKKKN